MKKFSFIGFLLVFNIATTFSQVSNDSIVMKKVMGGFQFYQNEQILKMSQLVNVMQSNTQAYEQIKAAQSTYILASVFAGTGGALIGYPLGTALGGGEPNWGVAGIGAVLVAISIPISRKFNNQAKTAISTFNNELETSSNLKKNELKFAFSKNGISLTFRF